jgi:hypothetical protein
MTTLYLLFSVLYLVLIVAWLWLEKRKHRARLWVAFLAIGSAAPFFTAVGAFVGTFSSNACYSGVVASFANLPETYRRTGNSEALAAMSTLASKLPLRGYETDCNELRAAVDAFIASHTLEALNARP